LNTITGEIYMQKIILFLFLIINTNSAQSVLTLDEAIKIALANSNDIALSKMNADAAAMQVYKANAGLTPRVDWNANTASSLNNVHQTFFDGRNVSRFGRAISPNTNVALSWTLYDGKKMQNKYELLGKQAELAKTAIQATEEDVKEMVMRQYYDIARQKETIAFTNNAMKYYTDRLNITEQRWQLGRGSKLDFLQSQNDVNTQILQLKSAEALLIDLKIALNLTLNRDANTIFDIATLQPNEKVYSYDEIYQYILSHDEMLKAYDQQIQISNLQVKDLEGNLKPRVGLNSSLGYSLSSTNAGLILINQNIGFNAGLTASWNLFDGKHNKTQIAIAKYKTSIIDKEKETTISRIKSAITLAINRYNTSKQLLAIDESNKKIAEENLNIAIEKFKLGASTILEVNDAQQRYDNAVNRHIASTFDVKLAELGVERFLF
jgi:outer membrane protein